MKLFMDPGDVPGLWPGRGAGKWCYEVMNTGVLSRRSSCTQRIRQVLQGGVCFTIMNKVLL